MLLDATRVQLESEVVRTPDEIRRRYRENRNWRYYPKEWIYRNIEIEGKSILDFGCGTGEIATQLAFLGAKRVYALDVTPGLLESTRRRAELDGVSGQVETVHAPIQEIPPRPVDVVLAFAVLHHCFPLQNVMPYLLRWLKPGGTFVAVEPVSHIKTLEEIRVRSGIPFDPLDEGERKLEPADLGFVASHFDEIRIHHFHLLSRFARLFPKADYPLRLLERLILGIPGAFKLAGTALVVGRRT
jgi:SAM-dependent methyltransferase